MGLNAITNRIMNSLENVSKQKYRDYQQHCVKRRSTEALKCRYSNPYWHFDKQLQMHSQASSISSKRLRESPILKN